MQRDTAEQIKQICAECSILNGFPEVFPRGCDYTQIERSGFIRAARPALSRFYETKKRGLLQQGKRTYIIE